MTVYVVGQVIAKTQQGFVWSCEGIFAKEADAQERCSGPHWFVGPVEIDSMVGDDIMQWPGAYFPKYLPGMEKVTS